MDVATNLVFVQHSKRSEANRMSAVYGLAGACSAASGGWSSLVTSTHWTVQSKDLVDGAVVKCTYQEARGNPLSVANIGRSGEAQDMRLAAEVCRIENSIMRAMFSFL
eukprot:3811561-Pyramimonas_sp.AAC.1